jgi:hypothetical protein
MFVCFEGSPNLNLIHMISLCECVCVSVCAFESENSGKSEEMNERLVT